MCVCVCVGVRVFRVIYIVPDHELAGIIIIMCVWCNYAHYNKLSRWLKSFKYTITPPQSTDL